MPRVKSVMTPFPNSVELDIPVSEAVKLMKNHDISYMPTTENANLIGVISERDIKYYLQKKCKKGREPTVRDIYIPDPYIVDLNEPLDKVLLSMSENQTDSTLVTRKEKLVGIFTARDACRSFCEYLQKQFPSDSDDILA